MNKDLIIGIFVSLLIHGCILGSEYLLPSKRKVEITKKEEETQQIQFEPPPVVDDDEKEVEELEDVEQAPMAPPSLVDIPTIVPPDAFTQQLTPPPPPDLMRDKSAVSIPVIKPGAKFGQGIKDLFNMADLDQQPRLRVPVQPTYPSDLKRQGIEGSCIVEFIVDSNGKVAQAQVVTATQREFENPSLQAVLKWQFTPGKKGGRSVNTRCQQKLEFKLNND